MSLLNGSFQNLQVYMEEEFEPVGEVVEEQETVKENYNGVIALDDKEFGKY